jgi:hypothetical protein
VRWDLERKLEVAGITPLHAAWFRTSDSDAFRIIVTLMEGAATTTSGLFGAGEAIDFIDDFLLSTNPNERHDLPHHVAVTVTLNEVQVWSQGPHHALGPVMATYSRGKFRGHCHHYPERVDLTLDDPQHGRIYLTGSWTHFNDECLHTARAAAAMATGPAY